MKKYPSALLLISMTGSALFLLATVARAAATAADIAAVTDFASLEKLAGKLAAQPYAPPTAKLDPFYEGLKYDDHRRIQFRKDLALYADASPFGVELFHPGWIFKKTIGLHELGGDKAKPLAAFDGGLFKYHELSVPATAVPPPGYSGFKITGLAADGKTRPEFAAFQGASYFRAVSGKLGWGLSARGVAINTVGGEPEEFPDFTDFWMVKPKPGDKAFQFHALLQGPSISGAYRFEVTPGEITFMRVSGSLFLRKPVKLLGLAPFSSMFWFGENTHPKPLDFRPEVHDSDGLLIEPATGPLIWRPLDNGRELRQSIFSLADLKGFGLQQRDREFKHYEDMEARYHERVSAWVEPIEGFGGGKLHLIEIATGEETWDNVVTLFEPAKQPTTKEPLRFAYYLNWLREKQHDQAKVLATRWGEAVATNEVPNDYLFVVDFSKGKPAAGKAADWAPKVALNITGGTHKVLDQRAMPNAETGGWRAFFKLDIPLETKLMEMTCELLDGDQLLSERWNYQWRR